MKKITYTTMRTELSDVLDLIRSGEDIVITQRGKPDIILTGKVNAKDSESGFFNTLPLFLPSNTVEKLQMAENNFNSLLNSSEIKKSIENLDQVAKKINNMSEEFSKALLYTKIRHADIIKKLEDN